MRTTKLNIYKFNELSQAAKDKAIEDNRDINVDCDWWDYDGIVNLDGIRCTPKYFDLDQGRYLQVDTHIDDEKLFCNALKIPERFHVHASIKFINNAGGPLQNTRIEVGFDFKIISKKMQGIIDTAISVWYAAINQAWHDLHNDYHDRLSHDMVAESLIANEYEFLENGKIYYS